MASYNARIDLDVNINKALSQIKKIESAIDRLSGIGSAGKEFKEALIPDVKGFRAIERELSNIKNRANSTAKVFARVFEGVSTAGVAGAGLQALNAEMFKLAQSTGTVAASIQELDKNTGGLSRFIPGFTALKDTVGASAQEVNKLQFNLQNFLNNTEGLREFVNKFYTMEGAAGAATAGLLALAGVLEGQLRESLGDIEQVSSKALGGLAKDAAKGTSELQRLINATQGTAKQYRNLIQVGEERRDSFNSASREARQATNTIVQAEKKLTDELRAQADLKRQAQGITVTELEASKGRQSIQTRQNAEAFRLKQLSEQEAVYQAIAKLNERDGTALQEKLGIQRNITNQVLLEEQRRESAEQRAATGLSRRIPTPYRTAGSMGFPVALPEIEQDRKIRAREEARQAAERALNLQKSNSLLTQGVTGLKAQVAIAEQLGGVYAEIVRSLERANDRQSQLFRARANRAQRQELGGENLQRLERINKLATNNVLQEQLKNKVALAGNAIKKNEFTVAKQIGKEIDQLLEAEDQRIDRARRVLRFRQRERQETRAIAKERAKSRKEALSNAIIGGAFPLLFGQGAGAAVGGGLGGAAGGLAGGQFGFGLSLVGTALGAVFDGLVDGAKRLGKALNPLTADVNAIVEATGQTDTVLGKLLVAYGDQDRAVELLSATIGKKSVTDLRRFGENVTKLTQEFSKSVTQLQVALLPLLNKVTKFLASQARNTRLDQAVFRGTFTGVELNTAFQNDPELIEAVEKSNKGLISKKELVFLGRRIALQRELGKELQLELQLRTKAVNETARLVQIERGRLALQAIGDNPFSQAKFELQEQVALQEKLIRDQQLLSEAKKDPLKAAQLQNNLALSQIKYESELAVIAKNKTAAEIKGINERYRLTEQLFSLEGKAVNANLQRLNDYANVLTRLNSALTSKISAAELLDEAILETSLVGGLEIDKITTQESGVIDALKRKIGDGTNLGSLDVQRFAELQSGVRSEEEIRAIDERFDTLKNVAKFEAKARTSILTIRKEELIAQERLEQSQRRAAFATEKSTLEARIKSPFGGDKFEQDLLGIEQLNRRTKELGELQADIDTKERAANKLRALGYLDTADRVDVEAKALRSRLTLREQEIAQIEELELAQLKLAQTVENVYGFVGPAVSSLIGGFQEVIAGTKSVEEAFADFLKTIADQLLQTAATMIAQYIALGIARAFAFGSSPQTPSFTAGLGTGLPLFGNYTGLSGNPFKGLANGGPATANSPYIVGERGPELFVPNSSGNVIPNDALGGTVINITNNISDEGSTSKTDAAGSAKSAADQLSKLMVAVIQREQRPGGVLSRR